MRQLRTAIVIAMLHWNSLNIMELGNNNFSHKSMQLFVFVSRKYFMLQQHESHWNKSNVVECNYGFGTSMLSLLDIMKNVSSEKSKLVKSITSVYQLSLDCSGDDQHITIYASSFFNKFTNLNKLNLTGITIDLKAMDHITNAFANNLFYTLKSLTVSNCHLDGVSAAKLLLSVNKNRIETLNLSNNQINNEASGAMNQFLDSNTTLQSINLANNCLTTETIFSIEESIVTCVRLQDFDISNNQITDDAAEVLIRLCYQLKSLKVDGNQLSDNIIKQIRSFKFFYN